MVSRNMQMLLTTITFGILLIVILSGCSSASPPSPVSLMRDSLHCATTGQARGYTTCLIDDPAYPDLTAYIGPDTDSRLIGGGSLCVSYRYLHVGKLSVYVSDVSGCLLHPDSGTGFNSQDLDRIALNVLEPLHRKFPDSNLEPRSIA